VTEKEKNTLRQALGSLEKSELIEFLLKQAEQLEILKKEVERLGTALDKSLRSEKRQAAPFGRISKSDTKQSKSPGRKKGHKGYYRQVSGSINEQIEVPLEACPHCRGQVDHLVPLDQIIEEIPVVQLRIIQLRTWQGQCSCCGDVRSSHPLQVSKARGSAATHLGPNAINWVIKLKHQFGLSVRKSCALLRSAFGLPLSPGGISQLEQRMAQKLLPDYEQLIEQARQANVLHSDETSWYVGQPGHWLWVFTNPDLSLYEVNSNRSRQVLEQMIGKDFKGTLVSDCLSIYENYGDQQQKCYAHHLKAIKSALEVEPNSSFLKLVRKVLLKAIGYGKIRQSFKPPDFARLCQHLEQRIDQLIPTIVNDNGKYEFDLDSCPFSLKPIEQKVANRLAKQRQHLFTFLYDQEVPPTNNLAERQLRPAVIQRKISCGNKTQKGARAWKILRSLWVTHQQRQQDFYFSICQALKRNLFPA
jgi:transposase